MSGDITITRAELDRMPCSCVHDGRDRKCGRGWIRCVARMLAYNRAVRARRRIAGRLRKRGAA